MFNNYIYFSEFQGKACFYSVKFGFIGNYKIVGFRMEDTRFMQDLNSPPSLPIGIS